MAHTYTTDPHWVRTARAHDRVAEHAYACINNLEPGEQGDIPCDLDYSAVAVMWPGNSVRNTCHYRSEYVWRNRPNDRAELDAYYARANNRVDRYAARNDMTQALKEYNATGEVTIEHQSFHRRNVKWHID